CFVPFVGYDFCPVDEFEVGAGGDEAGDDAAFPAVFCGADDGWPWVALVDAWEGAAGGLGDDPGVEGGFADAAEAGGEGDFADGDAVLPVPPDGPWFDGGGCGEFDAPSGGFCEWFAGLWAGFPLGDGAVVGFFLGAFDEAPPFFPGGVFGAAVAEGGVEVLFEAVEVVLGSGPASFFERDEGHCASEGGVVAAVGFGHAPGPFAVGGFHRVVSGGFLVAVPVERSEEHTSELQSRENLVCRLLLEKKKKN